jgi:hypothetical protein
MSFDPNTSVLAGMSTVQLRAALTAAQQAYTDLVTGSKVASVSYAQGDGNKSVQYTPASLPNLTAFIKLLQAQLGIVTTPRRPVRFNFR